MTFAEFEAKYNGVANVGDTPENLGQCTGPIEKWIDILGLPHVWGNACDLLTNADSASFIVVANSPTNAPSEGDIVVWGKAFNGTFGHTGIATKNCTDAILEVFEQNDPIGSPPHIKTYNYDSVSGWLHPRILSGTQTNEVPLTVEQVQGQLQTQVAATSQCLTQLKTAQDQVSQIQGQLAAETGIVKDLTDKLAQLQLKYDDSAKEVIAINDSLATLASSNKEYAQDALDNEHVAAYRLTLIESIAKSQDITTTGLKDADLTEKILAQNDGDKTLIQAQHDKIRMLQKIKLVTPQVVGDIKKNALSTNIQKLWSLFFVSNG